MIQPVVDASLLAAAQDAVTGALTDPFAFLGPHKTADGLAVRVFLPGAAAVKLQTPEGLELAELQATPTAGLFVGKLAKEQRYVLRIEWPGAVQETEDPYSFGPVLAERDLHLFREGALWDMADKLGAHITTVENVSGAFFAVWAPNARRVSVVGDFNSWDGRRHPMRLRHGAGIWEIFVPRLAAGERYKFEIVSANGALLQKADPLARATEPPPATASIIAGPEPFVWSDQVWMRRRAERQTAQAPISIYEVHLGSWLRQAGDDSPSIDWDAFAERLVPYVSEMGFTHIELLPIMGHPFEGSWGYQPLSLFAPSARFGEPSGLARFVNACHRMGIGVLLDWVPGHFPNDAHGLARFDGTALYEHEDPREGFHKDWNTLIYNYGRHEVRGFLIASALYWLETFHFDGLRVDAVASMLYRDYSRREGEWVPNRYGGRENLEAIDFLRRMNDMVAERCGGAITIAEESTAWPGVSAPTREGGLGFTFKWNMGWMHDTLRYMSHDPIHRRWHHHDMTFGLLYAYSERFILPLSHDEVVHGKGSLLGKMPGDPWQRFANLRAYLAFMWAHPGKKLLFMGGEIAQEREWSHDRQLDWWLLDNPENGGIQRLVQDLNALYGMEPALHALDASPHGFEWVVGDDSANSVFAFMRHGHGRSILCAFNMTPMARHNYRVGVPHGGLWREIVNSNAAIYGGNNIGNIEVTAENHPAHGKQQSVVLTLPPLSAVFFMTGDSI